MQLKDIEHDYLQRGHIRNIKQFVAVASEKNNKDLITLDVCLLDDQASQTVHAEYPGMNDDADGVLSGGAPGAHDIEGIGIGFTPPLWNRASVDEIIAVPTATAKETARRLAREEALFAGTSSGANIFAALRVAAQLGKGATVAMLMIDSGLKYVSTDLYRADG